MPIRKRTLWFLVAGSAVEHSGIIERNVICNTTVGTKSTQAINGGFSLATMASLIWLVLLPVGIYICQMKS